jgi:predicted ester cyclase
MTRSLSYVIVLLPGSRSAEPPWGMDGHGCNGAASDVHRNGFLHITDGEIVERWDETSMMALLRQIQV